MLPLRKASTPRTRPVDKPWGGDAIVAQCSQEGQGLPAAMWDFGPVDELPHRTVIDLQSALGKFRDQPAQGEVRLPAPVHQPVAVSTRDLLRLVAADLVRRDTAGPPKALNPKNRLLTPMPNCDAA